MSSIYLCERTCLPGISTKHVVSSYTNPYIKAGQRNPVGAKFSSVALSMSPLATMSKFSCFQAIRGPHPHCHGHLDFVAHKRCSTHSPKCGSWWVAGTVLLFPILITSRPALPYAPGSKWGIGTSPLPTPLYSRWGARPYLSCSCCWWWFTGIPLGRVSSTLLPRSGAVPAFLSVAADKEESQLLH